MALKDNKIFRSIIIPVCVLLCFAGIFLPGIGELPQSAVHVLCIFLGSLILWLTIGIDWPSLLCMFSLAFVRYDNEGSTAFLGFGSVLKNGFGNDVFLFLLFTFVCTYALGKTGILKRITLSFINSKLAKKSGLWFSFLFLFSVLLIGLITSPSVLFVIILAMLKEILEITKIEKGEKIGKALMMGLGFTVSISSCMTPIAHVFPVLAMQNLNSIGLSINTGSYILFAVPVGLIIFLLMFVMLFIVYKPDVSKLVNVDAIELESSLPKISKADIITFVTFAVVIILWVSIDITKSCITDEESTFYILLKSFGTVMPPLLGTIILCIVRVDKKPILKIDEALKNVPWSSLIMCAATLALSYALMAKEVGLREFLENNIGPLMSSLPIILLVIIFALWAMLQTNVSSNMVTANVVAAVAVGVFASIRAISPESVSDQQIKATVAIIGLLASLAFATPPSMPHIAIVGGSGYCSTKDVLIFGSILAVISVLISVGIGYPLALLVM